MAKKNTQKSLKALLLIPALVLLFYLPLKAEGNECKDNRILIESTKPENNANDIRFTSFELKSFENLRYLHSFIMGYKPYSSGLSFSRKRDESHPPLKEDSQKRFNLKNIENSLFTTSLLTFVALNAGDFYTTNKALKYKSLKEANPLLEPLTKNTLLFAAVKFGATAINYHLLKKLYKRNKKIAWVVSIASNFVMGYVVINNIRYIKYAQKNS